MAFAQRLTTWRKFDLMRFDAKMARLAQWCHDADESSLAQDGPQYRFLHVDRARFEKNRVQDFASLVARLPPTLSSPVKIKGCIAAPKMTQSLADAVGY